ncbi:CGLAU_01105 family protein [Corynebacterium guangdongense]|uniref:Uncharacterized protein n=1 Tax=Corynebacterium guangdongense TaxID=1783348 RepID=A0ABU2A108_9CORY|nr:CGLAU_01105 family protein [Corynebacterium guangdongense]MDR7330872.1 hypothetical protein [Corynebacterium guangdongense]WJZ16887.1 hypothetical protein CGUA_01435 [Corynebacterium guangdongense]
MTDDRTPPQDSGAADENSLLDSLKAAGSSLGGLVGEFTGAYRRDRAGSSQETGTHALHDPVEEKDTTVAQIRAAGADARRTFQEGSGFGAVKGAAGTFAGHAEGIVRDVAGSVVAAVDATRGSGKLDDVGGALGRVRDSVEETIGRVRGRGADGEESAGSADEGSTDIIDGEVISAETTETPVDEKDK